MTPDPWVARELGEYDPDADLLERDDYEDDRREDDDDHDSLLHWYGFS